MRRFNWWLPGIAAMSLFVGQINTQGADACCDQGCRISSGDVGCCDSSCGGFTCCDSGCCDSGCCDLGCLDRYAAKLGGCGLIKRSDRCFNDFISPMINFVFFEDPRTLTELRPIFVTHSVPQTIGAGIPAGGTIQLYAMQFRIALSERLSLIGVKDGYIVDNTGGVLDTLLGDGWAATSAGLKYNLLRDECRGRLASAGFTYELPGSQSALQDIADGEFYLFATAGQRFHQGDAHWLTSFGYRLPVDGDLQTSSLNWSNHFDVRLTNRVYAVTEFSWWHWTDDADAGTIPGVAGQDLFNLSAINVEGNDLVTQNVGLKIKPRSNVEAGIAFEFPVTGFQDVIENRLQLDLILRY